MENAKNETNVKKDNILDINDVKEGYDEELQDLSIKNENYTHISDEVFSTFKNVLVCLNLYNNKLLCLPPLDFPHLKILNVSKNALRSLDLKYLPSVETIYASNNKISSLTTESELPALTAIDLNSNPLNSVISIIEKSKNLRIISLSTKVPQSEKFFAAYYCKELTKFGRSKGSALKLNLEKMEKSLDDIIKLLFEIKFVDFDLSVSALLDHFRNDIKKSEAMPQGLNDAPEFKEFIINQLLAKYIKGPTTKVEPNSTLKIESSSSTACTSSDLPDTEPEVSLLVSNYMVSLDKEKSSDELNDYPSANFKFESTGVLSLDSDCRFDDPQQKVWAIKFLPVIDDTSTADSDILVVAEKNKLQFLNIQTRALEKSYVFGDSHELLYDVVFSRVDHDNRQSLIIATAGLKGYLYLLDAKSNVCYHQEILKDLDDNNSINNLLFDPGQSRTLFVGFDYYYVRSYYIPVPCHDSDEIEDCVLLRSFNFPMNLQRECFELIPQSAYDTESLSNETRYLLAGGYTPNSHRIASCYCWDTESKSEEHSYEFVLPISKRQEPNGEKSIVFDSVLHLGKGLIATKVSDQFCINIWNLKQTIETADNMLVKIVQVVPIGSLHYLSALPYLKMSYFPPILCAGDESRIWIYSLEKIFEENLTKPIILDIAYEPKLFKASRVVHWLVKDENEVKTPIIYNVIMNANIIVACSVNNLIGFWKSNLIE